MDASDGEGDGDEGDVDDDEEKDVGACSSEAHIPSLD